MQSGGICQDGCWAHIADIIDLKQGSRDNGTAGSDGHVRRELPAVVALRDCTAVKKLTNVECQLVSYLERRWQGDGRTCGCITSCGTGEESCAADKAVPCGQCDTEGVQCCPNTGFSREEVSSGIVAAAGADAQQPTFGNVELCAAIGIELIEATACEVVANN